MYALLSDLLELSRIGRMMNEPENISFNRLNPQVDGTGVGLAVVKQIIEFHGGRIWVQREAGKGATFHFTLPAGNQIQDNLP